MVGFQGESPADRRARWRAQLRGVSEMFKPCSRESERQKKREEKRARRSRVVLNSPSFGHP